MRGEQFLVLLPETPLHGAKRVAETLRREVADRPVAWAGENLQITASVGLAQALPGEVNVQALIGRADHALYRAKDEGGNCVRIAPDAGAAPCRRSAVTTRAASLTRNRAWPGPRGSRSASSGAPPTSPSGSRSRPIPVFLVAGLRWMAAGLVSVSSPWPPGAACPARGCGPASRCSAS